MAITMMSAQIFNNNECYRILIFSVIIPPLHHLLIDFAHVPLQFDYYSIAYLFIPLIDIQSNTLYLSYERDVSRI